MIQRPSWDSIWMNLAVSIADRATCKRMHVGCVLVSGDNSRVISLGYNGGGKGMENVCGSDEPGQCQCIHAEDNCLLKGDYNDPCRKILYVTLSPCLICAKRCLNFGISEIVYLNEYRKLDGLDYAKNAGIIVRKFMEQI